MRYQPGHNERVRKAVLEQAVLCLQEAGPDRTSLAELMSRSGMTSGGFYRHFESKEHLLLEAVDEMLLRSEQRFRAFLDGASPTMALSDYLQSYLSPEHLNDRSAGCALPSLSFDVLRMNDAARKRHASALKSLTSLMTGLLQEMGFAPDLALENATSAFAEMIGSVTVARAADKEADAILVLERSEIAIRKRLNLPPFALLPCLDDAQSQ